MLRSSCYHLIVLQCVRHYETHVGYFRNIINGTVVTSVGTIRSILHIQTTRRMNRLSLLSKSVRSTAVSARSFATYKSSTGIAGLAVDPNGRDNLLRLSAEVLENVKKIPEEAAYRKSVEKWFGFIHRTCAQTEDVKAIEDEIALGQIEQVIDMAKDELELVEIYYDEKGWEQVEEEKLRAAEMLKDMEDSINFTSTNNGQPHV